MMRILTVVGARPQFIKAATVSRVIAGYDDLYEVLVHTGQHFDEKLSQVFFDELEIPRPAYNLEIAGGSHGAMTGRMLERIEAVIEQEEPDWVLVYGDTNSTLAGALAAAKLNIPIAHIEAGLRSSNRAMPEEINRVLTDHASDLLFTPTDTATRNLVNEGIPEEQIYQVGDVMFDAVLFYAEKAMQSSDILARHGLTRKRYALATVHRQENTDDPVRLRAIFEGLQAVTKDRPVVLPLHPRTRSRLNTFELTELMGSLTVIPPVGYLDMVVLEQEAEVIITDSGGIQKEAYFYRVPCVTLRHETEWSELVELGWNRLVPPDITCIYTAVSEALDTSGCGVHLYGEGDAAKQIATVLEKK